jgi:outer membrane protein OmpA-like peptidoglycan-associated protein
MKSLKFPLALAALALASCASTVKPYDYSATTNATDEIARLDSEMATALSHQVNVLSPKHYADARKKLDEAKKDSQNRKSNATVLEDLGYAKSHLDAANEVAPRVEAALPEVCKARSDALSAEAVRLRNADLIDADQEFKKTAQDFESGTPTVSVEKRGDLQKKYLDVELAAIKINYLDQPKALIEAAKKMGAKKYGESTLASAEAKYQAAERTIESDRHNSIAIAQATNDATNEAKRAIEITRMAKGVKAQSPEETAIAMEAKRNEAARAAAIAERDSALKTDQLQGAHATIQGQKAVITATDAANAELEREKRFNTSFESARAMFTDSEADVYRQGDNLIVRLKSMRFPTNSAELPDSSYDVLKKVKDVITSMDADHISVEGHTDSIGTPAKNLALSNRRAETVAKYFIAEQSLPADRVSWKGFGDTRPLVSNKTANGRAQNRRVDVVITAAKPEKVPSSLSSATRAEPATTTQE